MSELNETPRGSRIHIAFFGLRNAGKSTLVNAFTGQQVAIVSDVAGTTTDPVSKAMEILPLGPCLITDTAGLDDTGALGLQRVEKSLAVLATTDIAVWVAAVVMLRELGVTSLRLVVASRGVVVPASWWGKIKTVSQIVAVVVILVSIFQKKLVVLNRQIREINSTITGFFCYTDIAKATFP